MNIALHIAQRMKLKNHLGIFIVSYQERKHFMFTEHLAAKAKCLYIMFIIFAFDVTFYLLTFSTCISVMSV